MLKDDKEIVSAISDALAAKIGLERYQLWFGAGVELRWNEQTLLVAVADNFRLDRIRRFRPEVLDACIAAGVVDAAVTFVIDAALQPPAPPRATRSRRSTPAAEKSMPLFDLTAPIDANVSAITSPERSVVPFTPAPVVAKSIAPIGEAGLARGPGGAAAATPRFARRQFASLDAFVVGDGNRMAHTAAQNVIARPGVYTPLLVHGPTGSGKTHLLEGIWSQARKNSPAARILYLSAEQFTTQFVEALRGAGLPNFRRKYRDVGLLLIDDVQFFAGKQSTLVELLHTIDALLRDGRQLVFAADRPPAELRALGPEIMTRLSGGLVCGVEPADYETRLKILEQMAARQSLTIAPPCLTWLAGQLDGDARQLAGALNRLQAASEAFGRPISVDFAQLALTDLLRTSRKTVRLPDIVEAVSEFFGVEAEQLQGAGKSPAVSHPRMLAMWLARKYTRAALSEIGRYFNRRSHSTVLSAQDKVGEWLASGKQLPLPHGSCTVEDALRRVESQLRLG